MSTYSIECPRCRETLTFRANQGEEFECAECGLDLEVDEGEVLYDPAAARLRPVDYVCPCCQSELSVYAFSGEGVECPDCSFEVVIEGRRAYYDEGEIEAKEDAILEKLRPDSEGEVLAIVRNASGALEHLSGGKSLQMFGAQAGLVIAMIRDSLNGRASIPWGTVASLAAALAYFVFPTDVIPDVLLGVGYIDDAWVLQKVLNQLRADVRGYAEVRDLDLAHYDLE